MATETRQPQSGKSPVVAAGDASQAAAPAGTAAATPDVVAARWVQPLRLHLSIVIVLLLIGISVPLMALTYEQGRRMALANAEQQMAQLSQQTIDRYRSLFGDGYSTVTVASVLTPLLTAPPQDLKANTDYLIKTLEGSPYMDGAYVGYPDGSFLHAVAVTRNPKWIEAADMPADTVFAVRTIEQQETGPVLTWRFLDRNNVTIAERSTDKVTYDPRRRPWYRAASKAGEPVSVGPYVTATTGSLALTLAAPMAGDGGVVVGVDLLLETLSRVLADGAVSTNARGFVFDREKKLIVHSDEATMNGILEGFAGVSKAGSQPPPVDQALDAIKEELRVIAENQDRTARFQVAGEPYLARISPVGFSDLLKGNTIVIAAPLSDFVGPSERLLRKNLIVTGIVLLAGILVALLVARLISRALLGLSEDARQIGNLDFDAPPAPNSWIAEINTLSRALAAAREAIRTFALYVPREVVRTIVASGQAKAGQAARQDVTVLFTDIRDFTTISEQHSPEEVVGMLSVYFDTMNPIVERHNGAIIQYLGDSIYAMWNAPLADPAHVDDACRCALELKAAIDELNLRCRREGRPELVTRFGVHTGEAVVGSVGAQARRQYTAMGDTVNVASRLEGMNKQYGTTILVSDAVRGKSGGGFTFRSLGVAQAKGRAAGIEIFELVGETNGTAPGA
ncbi:adenylate/guanylate cyclase domain-containing protein [Mesorhizobium sp. LHD-90]|uniref:adenylate/guanylate cyclase domain-containing protein n=1 Tax=Mesorhizobium sp. LHD-90 TaxID=3071414 RepID=UPI0027E0436B|nr:adenylate/guanylate cyclase domain-containing protein [Mesorhizobium sp. LHD-90]MDQ6432565.1 adenylate/guanylate cyclase domain-containing protein [Mesorhizobium sp. LHD-90]